MAEKRRGGCLVAALAVLGLSAGSAVLCCGGGALLLFLSPELLVRMFVEDQPLAVTMPPYDPVAADATRARMCGDLLAVRPTRLTGDELTNVLNGGASAEIDVLRFTTDGDRITMDASFTGPDMPGRWFNIHGAGGLVLEKGWATDFTIDEFVVSGWNLGQYTRGEQMAQNLNQSLANQRAESPEMAELLDAFDRIEVANGALELVPNSDAPATALVSEACAGYAAPAAPAIPDGAPASDAPPDPAAP